MINSLRDRIAAVIQSHLTWDAPNLSGDLADAVIRELRLAEAAQDCRCQLRYLWETNAPGGH